MYVCMYVCNYMYLNTLALVNIILFSSQDFTSICFSDNIIESISNDGVDNTS